MPLVLATNLTLNPDNQIAILSSVAGLFDNVEYSITGPYLIYDTRFIYRGTSDITLTRPPQGVLAPHTVVAVNVNTGPVALVSPGHSIYPYAIKDRLGALNLNLTFELSPGPLPPQSAHGGADKYKLWMDTSASPSPSLLRICVVPQASLTYVASEWVELFPIPTTGGGIIQFPGVLPDHGNASLNGNLSIAGTNGNLTVWGFADFLGAVAVGTALGVNGVTTIGNSAGLHNAQLTINDQNTFGQALRLYMNNDTVYLDAYINSLAAWKPQFQFAGPTGKMFLGNDLQIAGTLQVGNGITITNGALVVNSPGVSILQTVNATALFAGTLTTNTGIKYQTNDGLNTIGFGMASGPLSVYRNGTYIYDLFSANGGIISGTSPGYLQVVRNFPIPAPTTGTAIIWAVGADNENALVGCDAIGTSYPAFVMRRARGTGSGGITPVQTGDELGSLSFRGCTSPTTFSIERASVTAYATETWNTTRQGANLLFWTTPIGGTATTNTMTLDGLGNLTIPRQLNASTALVQANPTGGTLIVNANTTVPLTGILAGTPILQVQGVDGAACNVLQLAFAGGANYNGYRANGTAGTPTTLLAAQGTARFQAGGFDGATWVTNGPGQILFTTGELWSASAHGTIMQVSTTANGAITPVVNMTLDGSGNLTIVGGTATKAGGGAWVAPSDPRLKEPDARPYHEGLEAILALDPIVFRYNGRGGLRADKREYVGLDADVAADVFPSLVGEMEYRHVERDEDGEIVEVGEVETYRTIDATELTYALINAVKQLHERLVKVEN